MRSGKKKTVTDFYKWVHVEPDATEQTVLLSDGMESICIHPIVLKKTQSNDLCPVVFLSLSLSRS